MSQHEIISKTLPSETQLPAHSNQQSHHQRQRSLSRHQNPLSERGSECLGVSVNENATRGPSVSRRSLSSTTGSIDGPAIQISTRDPVLSISSSQKIPLFSRILQFLNRNFWKTNYFLQISYKRFFRIFFILLNLSEIYFVISFLILGVGLQNKIPSQLERFSAWLSVVYIFWFDYQSASSLRIILSSTRKYIILLLLFGLFIIVSVCIGTYDYHLNEYSINQDDSLVNDDISHDNYFSSFRNSLWTIFTSISSTNIPNQIIPYYSDSRSTFIYFFLYLSIGNFIFLNLVLVFIMAEYNTALQLTQRQKSYQRIHNLKMAFEVLDVYQRGCLSYSQVYDLLQEVYGSYPEFRGGRFHHKIPSMNEMAVLVAALDVNGDNFIYEEQFMWILHLTQIVILEKVSPIPLTFNSSLPRCKGIISNLSHLLSSRCISFTASFTSLALANTVVPLTSFS